MCACACVISREISRASASAVCTHFGCNFKATLVFRLRNRSLVCVFWCVYEQNHQNTPHGPILRVDSFCESLCFAFFLTNWNLANNEIQAPIYTCWLFGFMFILWFYCFFGLPNLWFETITILTGFCTPRPPSSAPTARPDTTPDSKTAFFIVIWVF